MNWCENGYPMIWIPRKVVSRREERTKAMAKLGEYNKTVLPSLITNQSTTRSS